MNSGLDAKKDELNLKSKEDLVELAKELNVKGNKTRMHKEELVDAIAQIQVETEETEAEERQMHKDSYIENVKVDTIVAFKINENKAISGKIYEIDKTKKMFTIVTKNGIKFVVKQENIIWVKTGQRWPRGVFNMLKGESTENDSKQEEC